METIAELKTAVSNLQKQIASGVQTIDLEHKQKRISELSKQQEDPNLWQDAEQARAVGQELGALKKITDKWLDLQGNTKALAEMLELVSADELAELLIEFEQLQKQYQTVELDLLFSGKWDDDDVLLELNAGAGGTEAQDWAQMLLRMYLRFAEREGFTATVLSQTNGEEVGIKSVAIEIKGQRAYGLLKGEQGTHRLVRISPFNAQAKRQTSFAGVIATPIFKEQELDIKIDSSEIKIDTFRAGGAGGQHINKTDSAVRITHLATGIVVSSQSQRSQHQNKEKALKVLQAKLQMLKEAEEAKKLASARSEVTEAAWGTQIRNYVLHPYKLAKDTRTSYESNNPEAVLDGKLDDFIYSYLQWRAEKQN